MTALTGGTKQLSGTDPTVQPIRNQLAKYLGGTDIGSMLFPTMSGNDPSLEPYRKLFQQQNIDTFSQAKESAGNLTGSGYGAYIGRAGERASTDQGSFLANLLENRRQQDANRYLSTLLGFGNSGVAPPQNVYQPGLFSYLAQAGTGLAQGGFFNSLINKSAAPAGG